MYRITRDQWTEEYTATTSEDDLIEGQGDTAQEALAALQELMEEKGLPL